MSLMSVRREGTVAILTLEAGENRHHPDFVAEILATLDAIEADEGATSCVIASSDPKNWSLGIDLSWIMSCMPDPTRHDDVRNFLAGLNRVYSRLLTYPMPVIAAIGGHCFGNGAIMACACDFRITRKDRGFFCFPEVDVNIPFLPGMLAVVKKAVPEPALTRWILEGRRVPGDEMVAAGVALKAVEGGDEVLAEAVAYGATFTKGRKIVGKLKSRMHKDVLATFDRDDPAIIKALALIA